ncbi:hypothetical protein OHD50_05990 [Escherichia coli]|nr:hypothetical protein [Escherichia coli]
MGTGPYELTPNQTDFVKVKNSRVGLAAALPKLDSITWRPVADNTRAAMLQTGEAQFGVSPFSTSSHTAGEKQKYRVDGPVRQLCSVSISMNVTQSCPITRRSVRR